jgi:hypothetical protein
MGGNVEGWGWGEVEWGMGGNKVGMMGVASRRGGWVGNGGCMLPGQPEAEPVVFNVKA